MEIDQTSKTLVIGVVGGCKDNVESRLGDGVCHFSRGIECGIPAESPVVTAYGRFLIDYGDIRRIYEFKDILEKKVVIPGSVRLCSLIDKSHMKKVVSHHHHMYIELFKGFFFRNGFRFRDHNGFACQGV